ncbi:SMI1/KNR4 family protein [Catellatospora coxensis]|uniref:SMI1/KNR4 family protein n=1 Tax=Catellatospora coxensis TaxID=310354 RepID=A0A8J3L293_9ACTN|nr:SMI1/KNR4 family protein [Catellatospora coxensis]GIG07704.1 SMI1/KNR4 family protein [Catellatospora coxensis]
MAGFDEVKATFWAGRDTPMTLPPLTGELLGEAERELGVTLPSSLVELLRLRNGGVVADAWNAFPTAEPTSWAPDHVPFDHLAGIGSAAGTITLSDNAYLVREWDLPSPVVLLSGDGHYWVALDYRACGAAGEPSVTWLDADFGTELHLADDFRAFVCGLTRSDHFDEAD